jgi:hypothetical protein
MPADPCPGLSSVSRYIARETAFQFRGRNFTFALSRELFSSADIDRGTRLLLKVFSRQLDEDTAAGRPLPRTVLDCGCGVGVIGICAAAALEKLRAGDPSIPAAGLRVRAQDRDELARLFTEYNARENRIPPDLFEAHTEPLLAGPAGGRWDLILSNIPAKAGRPVLEDFVLRAAALLNPGGRIMLVAVQPRAGFFRRRIESLGAGPPREEAGAEYSVFVYAGPSASSGTAARGPAEALPAGGRNFPADYPFYIRKSADYEMEGIPLRLDTVYGAPGFDSPGGAARAAAKLARRLGTEKLNLAAARAGGPMLVHEPGQGFFPLWLLKYLEEAGAGEAVSAPSLVLSGRNILALEAARRNAGAAFPPRNSGAPGRADRGDAPASGPEILAAPDLPAVKEGAFCFIAAFPGFVSRESPRASGEKDQYGLFWEGMARLLLPGGAALVALASAGAERLDRKKPPGFNRLGGIKREGFRAIAYNREGKGNFPSDPVEPSGLPGKEAAVFPGSGFTEHGAFPLSETDS